MSSGWSIGMLLALVTGCGGKVVVDGGGAGGVGGTGEGAAGPGPGSSSVASGGCLLVPPPVGAIDPDTCGGTSGGGECVTICSDQGGHQYSVECSGSGCRCIYDGNTADPVCVCVVEGGDACQNPCCPDPWVSF